MNAKHSSMCWIATLTIAMLARTTRGDAEEPEVGSISAALIEVTCDADAEVRLAAFTVLSEVPPTEAIVQAFRRGLDDDDGNVQRVALAGLVRLEGATDEIIQLLISRLNDPVASSTARNRLSYIGEPAIPFLIDAAKHDDTKRPAIQLLGATSLGDQQAQVVGTLIVALKDENNAVRLDATRSLGKIMKAKREGDARHRKYAESLLKKFDKNADGVLTEDEWMPIWKTSRLADVNLADADRDRRITAEELANWIWRRTNNKKKE